MEVLSVLLCVPTKVHGDGLNACDGSHCCLSLSVPIWPVCFVLTYDAAAIYLHLSETHGLLRKCVREDSVELTQTSSTFISVYLPLFPGSVQSWRDLNDLCVFLTKTNLLGCSGATRPLYPLQISSTYARRFLWKHPQNKNAHTHFGILVYLHIFEALILFSVVQLNQIH